MAKESLLQTFSIDLFATETYSDLRILHKYVLCANKDLLI